MVVFREQAHLEIERQMRASFDISAAEIFPAIAGIARAIERAAEADEGLRIGDDRQREDDENEGEEKYSFHNFLSIVISQRQSRGRRLPRRLRSARFCASA